MARTPSSVLSVAASQLGLSDGTKYGKWYVSKTGQPSWLAAQGVPWCAMFASWCMAQAGVSCAGLPGHYCPTVHATAKAKGRVVTASKAQPGDLVLFDWDGNGNPDHVGLVELNRGTYLQTIEGNVSGRVQRRTRAYGTVCACVRPEYDATTTKTATATTTTTEEEDVYIPSTVQQGTRSKSAALMQAALNLRNGAALAIDGYCGAVTVKAVKAWQKAKGIAQDGVCGPVTWAKLLGK